MSLETVKDAIQFAAKGGKSVGLSFFGGEPLLKKGLIKDAVKYAQSIEKQNDCTFHYKITTNGTLLDDLFLRFCTDNHVIIGLSIDGSKKAHNMHRVFKDGSLSYDTVEQTAKKLLKTQPYACAMMVINPDTIEYYAEGVQNLFDLGFKYFICSLNYEQQAAWTDEHMEELRRQFEKISDMYINWTLDERKFYFSPFEVKMRSHIIGEKYCEQRCRLGQRQLSVDTDGKLYPCVQFAGESQYCIGDIYDGIDEEKRQALFEQCEQVGELCAECAIEQRCNHTCGCLNKQATGMINGVSPVMCAHERISLEIADKTAAILYKKRSNMFMQKQYNDMFPLISWIEDNA